MWFMEGDMVLIQNTSSRWDGQVGVVKKWVSSHWYVVEAEETDIFIDATRNEIARV